MSKMMKLTRATLISFARKYHYILGLIGIQSVVFHDWLFSNRIFTFGDIGVYPPEAQRELFFNTQYFYTGNVDFGNVNIAASSNPFIFLYGLLGKFGINAIWSEKLLFFYPIVFGVILTSYFLIRYLTKSERGAFIGALIYSYNAYFLVTLTGALYISLAYAFVPLVFLAFLKVLDQPSMYHKFLFALLAACLGFIEFRIFYVVFLMMAVYFVFFLYFKKASFRTVLVYIRHFILPGVLFVLMNLFWIFPILFVGALMKNELFDRGLFGDGYFDIVNALTVFHPWWTWNIPSIFVKQTVAPFLFILPILVGILLFKRLRDSRIYIFFILFLVGVFLTKQSGAPFEAIYLWLYSHMPGFNAFRESSKFFSMSSLALAVLAGYFFTKTDAGIRAAYKSLWGWLSQGAFIGLLLIVFWNAKTVVTGDIGTMFIPRDVPREYSELNDFLTEHKEYSRVLWFPHVNRFGIATNAHPAVSMLLNIDTTYGDFSKSKQKKLEDHLYDPFQVNGFNSLLDRQSIRYIVVPSNLVWDDVKSPWRDPENFIEKLDAVSFLTRVDVPAFAQNGIYVYENKNHRPHIYLTREKETLRQEIPFEKIAFQFKNPTTYSIDLKNISEPTYVNFSEKYHPDWKIRAGEFQWFDALTQKNYFFPDNIHSENDAQLNSFLIDPIYIKQNFSEDTYMVNPDGSVNLELTLYFKPQAYYFVGLLVSTAVFIVSIIFLLYSRIIRNLRKITV